MVSLFNMDEPSDKRSIEWHIWKSCLSKKSYKKKNVDDVVDRFLSHGEMRYYYKCNFCNGYHITKNEPADGKFFFDVK